MLDHISIGVTNPGAGRDFYLKALAPLGSAVVKETPGARDNGVPGVRAEYHPNCYGAFVLGPDGHNVEVVCHRR